MNLFINGKNYYEILGVSNTASQDEIKQAFYKISIEHHSDFEQDEVSKQRFLDASTAYEVLKDEEKRKEYDENLKKIKGKENLIKEDEKSEKLKVYPKAKKVLSKKNALIAGGLALGVLVGYVIGSATKKSEPAETTYYTQNENIESSNNSEPSNTTVEPEEVKLLTAENIDEKVQEVLADNQEKGLNIDPTFIKSALFITNIDYLDQDDIKSLYGNTDINIIEEIQNMYNYTSAVGTHNNNVALGQQEGQYIALSNLAYDEQDKTILRELDEEFIDLVNGLNKDMTSEEYQESFKYITEFYTGFGYLTTNETEYSNYSLTAGGGLLSEQYWPMFSVIYADSQYLTKENAIDIKTLSYGTDGTDAVVNGSKYLGSIVNHESLKCLEDNQELESDKTLTKTQ